MFTSIDLKHLKEVDASAGPSCKHGPCVLFERVDSDGKKTRYFACSVCRNRKDCSFFLLESDFKKHGTVHHEKIETCKKDLDLIRVSETLELPAKDRIYCYDCHCFIRATDTHVRHKFLRPVEDGYLKWPTKLLTPLENNKKEAQYFFTRKVASDVTNMTEAVGVKKLICIGAPRIHEEVMNTRPTMESILLDIDTRYKSFYDSTTFFHFNMFNHHFFDGDDSFTAFKKYLKTDGKLDIGIVTDPPFGGRVELIANTLEWISKIWRMVNSSDVMDMEVPFFWIFPYFMEPHIKSSLPNSSMLDYKVDYVNHDSFSAGKKGRKQGSPVRIFTNVDPKLVPLPVEDGYRFCDLCQRWVSKENLHCNLCGFCPSKDGRTYVHCRKCNRCVKPTWQHCQKCNRCCLPDHPCGQIGPPLCKSCRELGHKWRDCPLRLEKQKKSAKRRKEEILVAEKKKLKIAVDFCGNTWEVTTADD